MTAQLNASLFLIAWQGKRDLPPAERVEAIADADGNPVDLDIEYALLQARVAEAMAVPA